jgi:hypothetical protein
VGLPEGATPGSFAAAAAFVLAMRVRFRTEKAGGSPDTAIAAEIGEGVR